MNTQQLSISFRSVQDKDQGSWTATLNVILTLRLIRRIYCARFASCSNVVHCC